MKSNNVLSLIKNNNIVIPNILLMNRKKLNIDEKELLFLAYLMSFEDIICFNIESFSKKLGYDINEIMGIMSSLEEKSLISMTTKKENNVIKEYILLDNLYKKLTSFVVEVEAMDDVSDSSVFSKIEEEFGRVLSPIEYETIKQWLDSNISEELIYEALKEAVLNGVYNIKYIDKILYEWSKKGYKKSSDIKKNKVNVKEENIELFDYDWLDDNE